MFECWRPNPGVRREDQPFRLHLLAAPAEGDQSPAGKSQLQGSETLATQVDELWALHDKTAGGGGIAAVKESLEPDFVAAISGDRRRGGGAGRWKSRGGGRGRGGKTTTRQLEPEVSKEARPGPRHGRPETGRGGQGPRRGWLLQRRGQPVPLRGQL
jgi:hypothetical protein